MGNCGLFFVFLKFGKNHQGPCKPTHELKPQRWTLKPRSSPNLSYLTKIYPMKPQFSTKSILFHFTSLSFGFYSTTFNFNYKTAAVLIKIYPIDQEIYPIGPPFWSKSILLDQIVCTFLRWSRLFRFS